MIALGLRLLASPIGRGALAGLAVLALCAFIYFKGKSDGSEETRVQFEREIREAVHKGRNARDKVLRDLGRLPPDSELPDDGFRRD